MKKIIIALATPYNKNGAISVIRLSGEGCISLVCNNIDINILSKKTHTATVCNFYDNTRTEKIDNVIVTIFKNKKSYTKEESVEISCHNSIYIIQKIIKTLIDNGANMADHGEFTKRAYLNGRFDIIQAEAIADLIAAKNKSAHDIAINQINGVLSKKIKNIKNKLIKISSLLNLDIDFSEENINCEQLQIIKTEISSLIEDLHLLVKNFEKGNVIKSGLEIAIIGKPNVGKSSLLNAILKEDRAIVSEIAGTTRDSIDAKIDIGDIECLFIDTAGLRKNTEDIIEKKGIEITKKIISNAKLIIYLIDVNSKENDFLEDINEIKRQKKDFIFVVNKIDLKENYKTDFNVCPDVFFISAKNNVGIQTIEDFIKNKYKILENEFVVNARHYDILSQILNILEKINKNLEKNTSPELISIDVDECLSKIGTLLYEKIESNDILNNIFSHFCIGK